MVKGQSQVLNYSVTKNEFGSWVDIKFFLELFLLFYNVSYKVGSVAKEGANFVLRYQNVEMV